MIVKMQKVTILVSDKNIEDSLKDLRKSGVVHIKHIQEDKDEKIALLEDKIGKTINVLSFTQKTDKLSYDVKKKKAIKNSDKKIDFLIEEANSLKTEEEKLIRQKNKIKSQLKWFENWGEFDPDSLNQLKDRKIFIKLYTLTHKEFKRIPSDKTIQVINQTKENVYIALISRDEEEKLKIPETNIPEKSLTSLKKENSIIINRIEEITKHKRDLAKYNKKFLIYKEKLQKELEFYKVKSGMHKEEGFAYVQGFCPRKFIPMLKSLASRRNWALLSQKPENPEEVPTLIKNPKWIKIIKPVFKFMGTFPGYDEYDISICFLLFLSIFFAMLVGDAGYGVLFLLVTFFAKRKFFHTQRKNDLFLLMYVFSGAAIIWGAVTGTWFGVEKIAQIPFFNYFVIDKVNSFVEQNHIFMMYLCFIIGVIHLSIGHIIVFLRYINSLFALSQVGWISVLWGLFFVVRKLIIGISLPWFASFLLIGGFLLIIFFTSPQRKILKGIAKGFGELPLKTINSFSDIVSYVRLFAVGYATVAVASSFNNMAMSVGFSSILRAFITAFILFLGHILNIILALMAVIVHGIRLNMLEFSNHVGMEWKGHEYRPFSEKDTNNY